MTEVIYKDEVGELAAMEDVFKVSENETFAKSARKSIKALTTAIEEKGGKVLSINTKLISKRRYKRKFAKALARQERLLQ